MYIFFCVCDDVKQNMIFCHNFNLGIFQLSRFRAESFNFTEIKHSKSRTSCMPPRLVIQISFFSATKLACATSETGIVNTRHSRLRYQFSQS